MSRGTETIDGSGGEIRSAIVRTSDGVYKRSVIKFALILFWGMDFCDEKQSRRGWGYTSSETNKLKIESSSEVVAWQAKINAAF